MNETASLQINDVQTNNVGVDGAGFGCVVLVGSGMVEEGGEGHDSKL